MTRTGLGLPIRGDWTRATRPGWVTASVFGLVVMATWTLVIKYLAPLLYAAAERSAGHDIAAPILWDFWWVAHLALAWLLWNGHRLSRPAGYAIASVEIAIVVVKFVLFLRAPEWSFWRLLWFTNKIYVLGFFVVFLIALLRRRPAAG
jgi:hypothetical protein